MKIRYIYGNSGSGKSALCINEIYEKSKNKNKNLIYIIPEQFTLQSEKKLVEKFPSGVFINIYVLSFKRLAHMIFSETGLYKSKILDDIGKLILIRKIAYETSKELTYFKNSIDKDGFLEKIGKSITEFFQYNITSEILENKIANLEKRPVLCEKLKDLKIIYKEYLEYLKKEYISQDETLDILTDKIKYSELIKDSEIWIDEFNGFTPQEFNVIKELSKHSEQLNITFCLNTMEITFNNLNLSDPFYEIKHAVNKLNNFVREASGEFLTHVHLKTNMRQKESPELIHLTQNYLKTRKKIYIHKTNNIIITKTSDKYSEVNMLALNILHLVREENYHYKDIAVILGNNDYENCVKNTFTQYQIPYFIDTKRDITSNRVTELVCSFLDIFTTNWSYEAVFRFLKTYLTPIEPLDVNILENYVLECGIKGKKWFIPEWEYGFTNPNFNKDDINYIKDCLIEMVRPFTDYIKTNRKYTIEEITYRLYNFLTSLELENVLDYTKSPECFQVYGMIMELLDKIVEILGKQKVILSEYSKILNSGIRSCKTGHLPESQDEVIIGDLKRTRLSKVKALFILTINDGIIPSIPDDSGILSDDDKIYLTESGLELPPTSFTQISQDNYLLYKMFSKPTKKLYLSYITHSSDGKEKRASKIINEIKKMFPNIKERNDTLSPFEKITLPQPTFAELTIPLFQYSKGTALDNIYIDLYTLFSEKRFFRHKLDIIEKKLFEKNTEDYLSKESVLKLYGKEISSSVSQLEKYAACPFSYFIEYGLKAKGRKIYEISIPDVGSIFHKIFEDFSKYLKNNKIKWEEISEDKIEEIVNQSIESILTEPKNKIFTSSAKNKFALGSIKKTSERSIKVLSEHIKAGKFVPLDFEVGFGKKYKLPAIIIELENNTKMILTGKIDRIDVLNKDGQNYIKIIDYKTGTKSCNLSDIYYGLQLQLLIYLDAFIKKGTKLIGENIFPGGIFYFKIHDPVIDLKDNINTTIENIKENILKEFKMSGIALNDKSILHMIDEIETGSSKIFSLILTTKGELRKGSEKNFATLEEFNELRNYVIALAKEYGNEIAKGNIKVYPYKKYNKQSNEKETGCEYCDFSPICQFEINEDANRFRKLKDIDDPMKEIIEHNKSLKNI